MLVAFWIVPTLHEMCSDIVALNVKCSCDACSSPEDPYPSSSIDLKCKERVTDSDSERGSGDESAPKVSGRLPTGCF